MKKFFLLIVSFYCLIGELSAARKPQLKRIPSDGYLADEEASSDEESQSFSLDDQKTSAQHKYNPNSYLLSIKKTAITADHILGLKSIYQDLSNEEKENGLLELINLGLGNIIPYLLTGSIGKIGGVASDLGPKSIRKLLFKAAELGNKKLVAAFLNQQEDLFPLLGNATSFLSTALKQEFRILDTLLEEKEFTHYLADCLNKNNQNVYVQFIRTFCSAACNHSAKTIGLMLNDNIAQYISNETLSQSYKETRDLTIKVMLRLLAIKRRITFSKSVKMVKRY